MKRKLVLTFDGNKLLHASLTERGKRTRLSNIAISADALKEVKDTLSGALLAIETASVAVIPSDATVMVDNTTKSSSQEGAPAALRFMLSVSDTAALGIGPGAPTCVVGPGTSLPADDAAEQTTSVASMQEDTPRARAVCARPKSDKDKSPSPSPFKDAVADGGW